MNRHLADANVETLLLEKTAEDGTTVQVHPHGNGKHNRTEWFTNYIIPLPPEEEES